MMSCFFDERFFLNKILQMALTASNSLRIPEYVNLQIFCHFLVQLLDTRCPLLSCEAICDVTDHGVRPASNKSAFQ